MTNQVPVSKDDAKGFFKELFDFSFKSWVTLRVAGILYAITIVFVVIFALATILILSTSGDALMLILALFGVPIISLLLILFIRISFESSIATIAIARNTDPKNLNNQ